MTIQYRKSANTGAAVAYATVNGVEIEVSYDSGFWRGVDDNYDEASEQTGFTFVAKSQDSKRFQWSTFLGAPADVQEQVDKIVAFLKDAPAHDGLKLKEVNI